MAANPVEAPVRDGVRRAARIAAAIGSAGLAYRVLRPRLHRLGATGEECARAMPGDEVLENPFFQATHAVSIRARPERVWPWLLQMGSGRAGWYSFDVIDNQGVPSAARLIPELQDLEIGDRVPMVAGAEIGPRVTRMDAPRMMLWEDAERGLTWAWELIPRPEGTRLLTRIRATFPRRHPLYGAVADAGHAVMAARMLRGIRRRAEALEQAMARRSSGQAGLIDAFIPDADIQESHEVVLRAPAELVFATAQSLDLAALPLARLLFWARGRMLGSRDPLRETPPGLLESTRAMGWRELAVRPEREMVLGAVAQPWLADPAFEAVPPEAFPDYAEPDRVKIAWTLEVEPVAPGLTRFRTQTRAVATDLAARRKFMRYWRVFGAGVVLIRVVMVAALKREVERRMRTLQRRPAPML